MRILLVEDSPINAELACEALTELGHEVQSTAFGREAEQLSNLVLFDVIILDVMVEDGSTYALAEQLFSQGRPFCVASAMNPALLKAPLCNVPMLRKPYGVADLIRLIERTGGVGRPGPTNADGAPRAHTPDQSGCP